MRLITFAGLVMASSTPALADPMTFEGAVARAAAEAPSVRADALAIRAGEANALAVSQLPDPKLSLSLENFPISGPPAFSLSEDEMTMARIGLSQELPNLAKRHARTASALAEIGTATAARSLTERNVRVAAGVAWVDLAFADRRLAAANEAIERIGAYRGSAVAGVASGSARPAEALDVRKAIANLEDMRAELTAERKRAQAILARWTGDPKPSARGPLPHIDPNEEELRTAVHALPELGAAEAAVRQAQADTALARAEKRPDWMFEVAYGRRAPRYGDMLSAGVTLTLPLFPKRRQDAALAASEAAAGAATARMQDVSRSLAAEVEGALADHVMHHEQWERARDTLLPLARQQADLETASYGAGRASLVQVIASRTALVETALLVLEREAAVARDAARLLLTYGGTSHAAH